MSIKLTVTDEQLAELEAAEAKATPGPWKFKHDWPKEGCFNFTRDGVFHPVSFLQVLNHELEDVEFIALARNNLKALIDEAKKWRQLHKVCCELNGAPLNDENKPLGVAASYSLLTMERDDLRAQLEVAKEALKFYSDGFNLQVKVLGRQRINELITEHAIPKAISDQGNKAREALAKIEGEKK